MEEPVSERVVFSAADRACRAAALVGQHVVPLEDLVEHDSVHKPTEPDAKEKRGKQLGVTPHCGYIPPRSERNPASPRPSLPFFFFRSGPEN